MFLVLLDSFGSIKKIPKDLVTLSLEKSSDLIYDTSKFPTVQATGVRALTCQPSAALSWSEGESVTSSPGELSSQARVTALNSSQRKCI